MRNDLLAMEILIKIDMVVSSSQQIATSSLLPPTLRCGGHGTMTASLQTALGECIRQQTAKLRNHHEPRRFNPLYSIIPILNEHSFPPQNKNRCWFF